MGAGSSEQPIRGSNPLQQPSLSRNVLQGSLQQPSQLGPLQPTHQLGSSQQSSKLGPPSMPQLIKSDESSMPTLSDYILKQIQGTHTPDGRQVEIRPLLYVVEIILNYAAPTPDCPITTGTQAHIISLEKTTLDAHLTHSIDRIFRQISFKNSIQEAPQTSLGILRELGSYSWDAKLVIILSAFASHYGEFYLFRQIYLTNPLANSMGLLRQGGGGIINEGIGALNLINDLIKEMLEVTHCIVKFSELPSNAITLEVVRTLIRSAKVHDNILTAVYWTIWSVLALTSFTSKEYNLFVKSTTEPYWELPALARKLKNVCDRLKEELEMCYKHIENYFLDNLYAVFDIDDKASSTIPNDGGQGWSRKLLWELKGDLQGQCQSPPPSVLDGGKPEDNDEIMNYLKAHEPIIRHVPKDQWEQWVRNNRPNVEPPKMLVELFEKRHIDNMKVLKALIYSEDNLQPLVDGSKNKRVHIDVLRKKKVFLLLSDLNISHDEVSFLKQKWRSHQGARGGGISPWLHPIQFIRNCARTWLLENDHYEVVWIPIVDPSIQWTDQVQKQFENLRSTMPWYTVHPSLIGKVATKFMKKKWHFMNKPIIVVLDPQGRVVSPNAIHSMRIWGSNAFPLTSTREEALWSKETWRLELLVDDIDPTILNWIEDGKYIFLYGGDDTEWVRKFTSSARAAALAASISLEMVYVGNGDKRKQLGQVIETIKVEKLSSCWQDLANIQFFWTRLESMLYSKIQIGKADDPNHDPVMQEIEKLLRYDREGRWAVLSKGSEVAVNGHGNAVLATLLEYDTWKENVSMQGFDVAFKKHYDLRPDHYRKHSYCCFELSPAAGRIPERMRCPQCLRDMKEHTTLLCWHK